jgi:signal transduction histidine kinase
MFAGSLAGSLVVLLVSGDAVDAWVWILFAALPLWHWAGLVAAYRLTPAWEERQGLRIVVIAGDIALWFFLVRVNPAFYFILFGLYGQVFRHLRTSYASIASAVITILIVVRETVLRGQPINLWNPLIWVLVGTAGAGIVMGLYISSIVRQSSERKELIRKLESTRAELADVVHREAVLQERQRLAREIHDTLAQGFTSIVIHLETALAEMDSSADVAGRERIEVAADTARRSLGEARRVVRDLRPDILESASLVHAIERAAARWQSEHGVPATVAVIGDPSELGGDREVTLYRATEESLANILKHARASSVEIQLRFGECTVELTVTDDGAGMASTSRSDGGGYGIRGMRERAEALGGTVDIESGAGGGTVVRLELPLEQL